MSQPRAPGWLFAYASGITACFWGCILSQQFVFRPPSGLGGLTVTLLSGQVGLRLMGEADVSTIDALQRGIAALPPGPSEIHLHLIALDFMDVRSAAELIALTRLPSKPLLILHYPPIALPRIITLLWPEAYSQIGIDGQRGTGPSPPAATPHAPPQPRSGRRHRWQRQRMTATTLNHVACDEPPTRCDSS